MWWVQHKEEYPVPVSSTVAAKPVFTYFPLAGRGELARLIAVAGGLEIEEQTMTFADDYKGFSTGLGFTGTLPVLQHGQTTICQSAAVENYLVAIAPKYADISPQQRSVDDMYAMMKEDICQALVGVLFGDRTALTTVGPVSQECPVDLNST
jgi:hypothetical protein